MMGLFSSSALPYSCISCDLFVCLSYVLYALEEVLAASRFHSFGIHLACALLEPTLWLFACYSPVHLIHSNRFYCHNIKMDMDLH